jgi:16S rRNA (adenine1518-N6/adenine1519-N6)-dimethyltransferase
VKRSRAHALGQHFLSHPGLLAKIVRVIDPRSDELIIEVGPGRGALTALLAQKAGRVIGVEKDDRLIPLLEGRNLPRTSIIHGDILTADWTALVRESGIGAGKAKLAGNIPYAISSPLLARVLETRTLFSRCVFLLQKEFAERLAAGPGSKKYAPLSLLMQRAFAVKQHFGVSRQAFVPPPRVESAVVSLTPREQPEFPVDDEPLLAAFLRASFAQRRKTLANNLERAGLPRETVAAALVANGLGAKVRAEEVPTAEFTALFARFEAALPLASVLAGQNAPRAAGTSRRQPR